MKNKFFFITAICSILINASCGAMKQQPVRQNNQERQIMVGALVVNKNQEYLIVHRKDRWTIPATEFKKEDLMLSNAAQRCMLKHLNMQLEPSTHMFDGHTPDNNDNNTLSIFVIFNLIAQQPQIMTPRYTGYQWKPIEDMCLDNPVQEKIYDILKNLPQKATLDQSSNSSSSSSSSARKRKADEIYGVDFVIV